MSPTEFGPFGPLFEKGELAVPAYLELLQLRDHGAQIAMDRIETALSVGSPQHWLDLLFADSNWRPHLVGALALLLDQRASLNPMPLWSAIDRGSWVAPQLVVAAHLVDSSFPDRARERVAKNCLVRLPENLTPVDHHVAMGSATTIQRSAKLMASILFAARRHPRLTDWAHQVFMQPDIVDLLEHDVDESAAIAGRWLANLKTQLALRGRTLPAPAA